MVWSVFSFPVGWNVFPVGWNVLRPEVYPSISGHGGESCVVDESCDRRVCPLDGSSSVGPAAADAGILGSLFQTQAKRIEALVLRQLQDRKTIEFLLRQLVATGQLVRSLEQHHVAQMQQIESNLLRALEVYEKARVLRHQQNQVQKVVVNLTNDLRILRGAVSSDSSFNDTSVSDDGAMPPPARTLSEPPSLAELLPQSQRGAATDLHSSSSASNHSPPDQGDSSSHSFSSTNAKAKDTSKSEASKGSAPMPSTQGAAGAGATEMALEVSRPTRSYRSPCPAHIHARRVASLPRVRLSSPLSCVAPLCA